MSENSDLQTLLLGMLGELEDHATRLTRRQAELARELAEVDGELQRVEAIRAMMAGKNPRRPSAVAAKARKRTRTDIRRDKIAEFAREHGDEFTGRQAADALGVAYQGIGPALAGMVRRGEASVREDAAGNRFYSLRSGDS